MTAFPSSADTAYTNAPNVQEETEEILRLRRASRISDREWLLRHAALTDRQTVGADPADGKVQTARQTIVAKLLAYDRANGTTTGPLGIDDPAWVADPCGYVRQEYAIWAAGDARP
ncbi:hypothetical protein [Streptomyces sp. KS 21]|uniref:hypothetical protein n=1 Tax=Streptomyces sp. KS 21 TaxID=2485150 RepID=UPI0010633A48|nr:hypothetical protein [Streptomyces sp. KS 21]TDU67904.1 hypothetical protein EDD91_7963 [Streptomyces sp. KS 21]